MSTEKPSSESIRRMLATAKVVAGQVLTFGERLRRLHRDALAATFGAALGCLIATPFFILFPALPVVLIPIVAGIAALICAILALYVRRAISRDGDTIRKQESLQELIAFLPNVKEAPSSVRENFWKRFDELMDDRFGNGGAGKPKSSPPRLRLPTTPTPDGDPAGPSANDEPPDDEPTPQVKKALKKRLDEE